MSKLGKAMVFNTPGKPFQLKSFPLPVLSHGELLVAIKYCAICASDLHTFQGKREGPVPSVLGHEIVGCIREIPESGVQKDLRGKVLQVGDFITWSLAASCGNCHYCVREMPQKCERLIKYGHSRITKTFRFNGGMADHVQLRKGTAVVKLNQQVPLHIYTALNCSMATVMAAIDSVNVIKNRTAVIFGAGMLGTLCAAVLTIKGATRVIAIDPNKNRLETIQNFGAHHAIEWEYRKTKDRNTYINHLTGGYGADMIFEMSGSDKVMQMVPQILGKGGQLILCGSVFPTTDFLMNPEAIVRNLWEIKGIHNYRPEHLLQAETFLSQHYNDFPFDSLFCTDFFNLEAANEAMEMAMSKKFHRVVIRANSYKDI